MVNVANRVLTHLGINTERLLLEWVSAAEGPRFAKVVTDIINKVKELGPLSNDAENGIDDLNAKLKAAKAVVSGEKLRWVAAKQTEFEKDGNKYGEVFTSHELGRSLDGVILEELAVQQILDMLGHGTASVKDLSQKLRLPSPDVFRHVAALLRKEMVKISEVKGRTPFYSV